MLRDVVATTKSAAANSDDPAMSAAWSLSQFSGFYLRLGEEMRSAGHTNAAEDCQRRAGSLLDRLLGDFAGDPTFLPYLYRHNIAALAGVGSRVQLNALCHRLLDDQTPLDAAVYNDAAWTLAAAISVEPLEEPDAVLSVALATRAVGAEPHSARCRNTLGVAHYRAGQWKQAVAELDESVRLGNGGTCEDFFFLAMAHGRLGNEGEARNFYDRAVMKTSQGGFDADLARRFRQEAAELMGMNDDRP
jgi:tetratricopeptide (TPR) repeat protein